MSDSPSLADFRLRLVELGYSRATLRSLGAFAGVPIDRESAIEQTGDRSNISIAVRMFFLRVPVAPALAKTALGEGVFDILLSEGVLTLQDGAVVSQCAVIPIGDIYTLRDFEPNETGLPLRPDHVLGVGKATSILSMLTVRRPVARALDIGCGQGFHAMIAAGSHAGHVTGTDINTRALWMARLSAKINYLANITFVEGSLFDAVKGQEPFDLIVSNPPFIISPPHDLVCLGGSAVGDGLVAELISGVPGHLAPGGYACVMCNWYHNGEEWSKRPRSWIPPGSSCDAWLIETRRETAQEYIEGWMKEAEFASRGDGTLTANAWSEYLRSLEATHISLGCMILRKRAGGEILGVQTPANWFRADSLDIETCTSEAGEQIEQIFANQTLLANLSEESTLVDLPLSLAATARLTQTLGTTDGEPGWKPLTATLRHAEGFEMTLDLDPHAAALLGAFAGTGATPRAAVMALAQELKTDPQRALGAAGAFLAHMLSAGYLCAPVDHPL
jgi:methylase of polypeptide subunit release factors